MSRYRIELATLEDDADLRAVMAATPMDGRISVAFHREPSWFAGAVVDGTFRQVIACREVLSGKLVGFGCRSLREVYVNGEPATVGYLSSLRLLPEHRNIGLIARGYAKLRELHRDGRAPYYLTTIAEGNETALKILTSGRAGLPIYHPFGAYHTVALPISRGGKGSMSPGVRTANMSDLPTILAFLSRIGPNRQFFPRLTEQDFGSEQGAMRGLEMKNVLLAERGGDLLGMIAGWDQHSFRQSVVREYHGTLRYLRPIYNLWKGLSGQRVLPSKGQPFRYLMAALPVVADDDVEVLESLLKTLLHQAAGGPWSHLLLGLHERDPLLSVARRYQIATYTTRLYVVCWQDGDNSRLEIDDRAPYLEAGSL